MAGRNVPVSGSVNLVLVLDKTFTGQYPQAKIYNTSNVLQDTVNLVEQSGIGEAIYQASWTAPVYTGDFYVIYKVFSDSGRTTLNPSIPSHAEETINVIDTTIATPTPAFSYNHSLTNSDTLAGIDGADVYVYSDSGRTTLVAHEVTDALGACTTYHDAAGTYYRRVIASGYDTIEDTITVT